MKQSIFVNNNEIIKLSIGILIILFVYKYNTKNKVAQKAIPGQYSDIGYTQISPMKNDFCKIIVVNVLTLAIFESLERKSFANIIRNTVINIFVLSIYYQIIQPYIVNDIPAF